MSLTHERSLPVEEHELKITPEKQAAINAAIVTDLHLLEFSKSMKGEVGFIDHGDKVLNQMAQQDKARGTGADDRQPEEKAPAPDNGVKQSAVAEVFGSQAANEHQEVEAKQIAEVTQNIKAMQTKDTVGTQPHDKLDTAVQEQVIMGQASLMALKDRQGQLAAVTGTAMAGQVEDVNAEVVGHKAAEKTGIAGLVLSAENVSLESLGQMKPPETVKGAHLDKALELKEKRNAAFAASLPEFTAAT